MKAGRGFVFRRVAAATALIAGLALPPPGARGAGLRGVWAPVSISNFWPGGASRVDAPQPGFFIFGERHYCFAWVPGGDPRTPSEKRWLPTEREKAAMFDSVILNAGTYSAGDSELEVRPAVAKTPEFVGGRAVWRYEVTGDTLRLENLDIVSFDGVRDPGIGRIRTLIVLVRAE